MRAQLLADRQRDITIEVRFFAGIAQEVGCRSIKLTFPSECNILDVEEQLLLRYPQLKRWLGVSRWAMQDRFVVNKEAVVDASVLDLIPPVSGG